MATYDNRGLHRKRRGSAGRRHSTETPGYTGQVRTESRRQTHTLTAQTKMYDVTRNHETYTH